MTLIVGRIVGGKTYVLGDTALKIYRKSQANPYVEGCLKQYRVSDQLAVSFADNQASFERYSQSILSEKAADKIASIAVSAQREGADFELLIADAKNNQIVVVKQTKVCAGQAGYIGDADAFGAFQEAFHGTELQSNDVELNKLSLANRRVPEPILENEPYTKLFVAMKSVCTNSSIERVGGAVIPLCTDKGVFRYMNYTDVVSDRLSLDQLRTGPTPVSFGSASGGGFAVEFCDDTPYGGEGSNIGLYFLQGGFGIVYRVGLTGLRTAEIVQASNPAYWVLETKRLLGHSIGSGFLTADHCGIAGEELLQEGRFYDAVSCLELRKDWKPLWERPQVADRYFFALAKALFATGRKIEAAETLSRQLERQVASPLCRSAFNSLWI